MIKWIQILNNKKVLLMIPALFLMMSSNAFAQSLQEPNVGFKKVHLGKDVAKALKSKNANFRLLQEKHFSKDSLELSKGSPMAVVADFNNDGIKDIALYGIDKSQRKAVIYMVVSDSKRAQYEVHEVESSDLDKSILENNENYLSNNTLLKHKRDVLLVEFFGESYAGHTTYYFSNTKNKVLVLGKYDQFVE